MPWPLAGHPRWGSVLPLRSAGADQPVRRESAEGFAETSEPLDFELADPFAGEAQLLADLLERPRIVVVEAEAQADHQGFALIHLGQVVIHLLEVVRLQEFLQRPPAAVVDEDLAR